MSSNDLPVTDVVGVYASHGQSRAAGASPGDAFVQPVQNSAATAANAVVPAASPSAENAANNIKVPESHAVDSTSSAEAGAEIARPTSGAYSSKEAAQDAINKGSEARKEFIVWGVIDGDVWAERYQNINGVATPSGVMIKNGMFFDASAIVVKSSNATMSIKNPDIDKVENHSGAGNLKYTDGRSLYGFRLKKAKLIKGGNVRLNIGYIGDSWSEFNRLPKNMAGRLFADFGGRAGAGWLQFITDGNSAWENMVVTRTKWQEYDASWSKTTPPYGSGPDGIGYYSSRTDSTIRVTNIKATEIKLYYYDTTGTFRYAIDGGAPVSVVGGGTNTIKKVVISGLTDSRQTLDIDTVGNTGVASLLGAYLTSSTRGVIVNKMGNGGTFGAQHLLFQNQIPNYTKDLDLDLIVVNLGTNDYSQSRGTRQYINALTTMINTYRTALPNVGIILVSPAQCNATGIYPMTSYRDAMRKVARENNVEWFSFYDDMPPNWTTGKEFGAWQDGFHLSDIGAEAYTTPIYNYFIKP
jgi:lysophospholipase L1-like esterase